MRHRDLIEQFSRLKILVIGDIMLDHYVHGDIHRMSPEAPVPVISVSSNKYAPGGAANVACNLANLGIQTILLGSYGEDEAGQKLEQILDVAKIHRLSIGKKSGTQTILKKRVVAKQQQICRLDYEGSEEQYKITLGNGIDELERTIDEVDAIIFSDYAKGTLDQPIIDYVLKRAQQRARPPFIAVGPKPNNPVTWSGIDLVTANEEETMQMSQSKHVSDSDFYDPAFFESAHRCWKSKQLVITLGAAGMLIGADGHFLKHIPALAREVYDVSGAGDTALAMLTSALTCGADLHTAAKLANIAAGIVVGHHGTAPIRVSELLEIKD